jgi:hypothetical protein
MPDDLFEMLPVLRNGFQPQTSVARLASSTTHGKSKGRVSDRKVTT